MLINVTVVKATVTRSRNKNGQLHFTRTAALNEMLRIIFYHLLSANLSCNKSGWRKLRKCWQLTGRNYAGDTPYTAGTCCQASLPWPVKCATCTHFVAKSITTLYFLQQLFVTQNNLIVARQLWFVGGKTRSIDRFSTNFSLQKCRRTSCMFLSLVFPYLNVYLMLLIWVSKGTLIF